MTPQKQRPGRPRDNRIDDAVLHAARDLLVERGYDGFTIEEIAARAGIGKAAIYRRYRSKAEMVFAASVHDLHAEPPGDTGSLHGDLLAFAYFIRDNIGRPAARQAGPALVAELARDPDLVTRFRQTFLAKEQRDFATVVDRAVDRGELARPVDAALLHLLLTGPVFTALVGLHTPVDDQLLEDTVTVLAAGITALAAAPQRQPRAGRTG
jgi:AcrR family transcriptional regulator